MFMPMAAGLIAAITLLPPTDTVLAVERGARLNVQNQSGEVTIGVWDRNAVRITADHDERVRPTIDRTGSLVSVRSRSRFGPPASVDYQITVPAWMAVRVSGPFNDVTVQGSRSEIQVETVQGDVYVRGGRGFVLLRSVEGEIILEDAEGRLEAHTVNGEIRIRRSSGEVQAETVNGDIALDVVESLDARATTINGDLDYDGPIRDGGRYHFATHNGEVSVAVARDANATVSVSTFNGEFEASFPIQLSEYHRGRRFSFVLGDGSAQLEIQAFQGTIRLHRPRRGPSTEN